MNARVDFTPMVDMIMLLVTFFMLCTSLLKPQAMQLSMPSDKEDQQDEQRSQAKASEAVTILAAPDRIFYFEGKAENAAENLVETKYGKDGIRAFLLKKNAKAQVEVDKLKKEFEVRDINEESKKEYNERLSEIKSAKGTPTVIIKINDDASFNNMMKILDEMLICNIGKYVIDNFSEADKELLATKGVKLAQ